MTRVNDGYSISIVSMKGAAHITQNMLCDSTLATRQWHYKSDQNTDISLCRNGDCIEVSGVFQGNPVKKKLAIEGGPWCQIIPLGLETASRDTSGRSNLWAVSLDRPAVLKAVCFHIDKISNTPLSDHPEIRCTCFRMSIKGLPCQNLRPVIISYGKATMCFYTVKDTLLDQKSPPIPLNRSAIKKLTQI